MDPVEISRWNLAAELLERLLDMPQEQQDRTAAALGQEHGVRAELGALLAGVRTGSVLDNSLEYALQDMPASAPGHNAFKGQVIGNWLLGDEFGRGGMSVIYHASRADQEFEQHAALKILSVAHLGSDFVESFLRERQILSDLHHPGIARLIDGGITPGGAPFLVMQYVDGVRIDQWCEDHEADLPTVIGLMIRLCHAVAYAQRHLVVHQDINPSNVLVDEHGHPILIDFGIARILGHASKKKMLRAFTPRYAAPEQRAGGAITTATDVYGLGILLRELTGQYSLDRDLEAILQCANQGDPALRYANARQLASDLEAWREKRPVQARSATLRYRAGRFIARNRSGVAAALLVLVSILSGLGVAIWQAQIASAERDEARAESERAEQVTEFLKDLFLASDPDQAQGEEVTARELLDRGGYQLGYAFDDTPELKAEMLILLGDLYRELGELEQAKPMFRNALDLAETLDSDELRIGVLRGDALLKMESGENDAALELAERAEDILRRMGMIPGAQHATLMNPILFNLAETGRVPEAVARGEAILSRVREHPELSPEVLYQYLYDIANVMLVAEEVDKAEALLTEAASLRVDSARDPTAQIALYSNLAGILDRRGNLDDALEYRRAAVALTEKIYPPEHVERARKLSNLGSTLSKLGRHEEAREALRETLSIYDRIYGNKPHPRVAAAHNNLGRALQQSGQFELAEPHLVQAREMARQLFGVDDPRYVVVTGNLGDIQRRMGNFASAEALLLENVELRKRLFGPDHRAVGDGLSLLAALRLDQGRFDEALQLVEESLELFQRIGYQNPASLVAAETRRASALAGLGRDAEAEAGFADALVLGEAAGIDAGTAWPALLAAHAEYLLEREDAAAAAAVERALRVHRQILGERHPETRRIGAWLDG